MIAVRMLLGLALRATRSRALAALVVIGTIVTCVRPAFAGTYLDAAAILLDESRRAGDFVQARLGDVQLAGLAQKLAEARVRAGREIPVPKEVERAHPHLLLVLEATERAMAAAQDGELKRFFHLILDARREEQTYRVILSQLHMNLPELVRCSK